MNGTTAQRSTTTTIANTAATATSTFKFAAATITDANSFTSYSPRIPYHLPQQQLHRLIEPLPCSCYHLCQAYEYVRLPPRPDCSEISSISTFALLFMIVSRDLDYPLKHVQLMVQGLGAGARMRRTMLVQIAYCCGEESIRGKQESQPSPRLRSRLPEIQSRPRSGNTNTELHGMSNLSHTVLVTI
jgi:hypothetical protein